MALIKCVECGKMISDDAGSCPHCGKPIVIVKEEPVETKGGGGKIIAVLLLLAILGGSGYFAYNKYFKNPDSVDNAVDEIVHYLKAE
jgi:hypothetical protein